MIQGWVGYGLNESGFGWIRIEWIRVGMDTDLMNQGWVWYGLNESGLGQTRIGSIRIGLDESWFCQESRNPFVETPDRNISGTFILV